jgi:parallel beta-helix repeat protein
MNKIRDGAGGIYLNLSDITVQENICLNNRIGIIVDFSNSVVINNIIKSNFESDDGINISDLSHTKSPTIAFNYIETNGIGIFSHLGTKTTTINNNIIVFVDPNSAGGIRILSADTVKVFNNLIIAKEYLAGYSGISTWGLPRIISNNLIYGSAEADGTGINITGQDMHLVQIKNNSIIGGEYGIRSSETGNVPAFYNNIWNTDVNFSGFTPDTTNLSVDPMMVNEDTTQGELDFHLQMFSPLIDAGDPNILDVDSTRSDIGLYGGPYGESYIYIDLPPRPPVNLTAEVDSNIITLRWNKNTESDFNHYNLYRDTVKNFTIDSTKLVASLQDTFYLHIVPTGIESLYFKLTGVDNQGNESSPSEEVSVILVSVKEEWQAVNNFVLYQNYPNPFNPTTKIGYKLKERGYVKLYVYDVKGELVEVLVNQTQDAGYYEVEFNGEGKTEMLTVKNPFASGFYIYQILVQNEKGIPVYSDIKKMILLK